MVSNAKLRNSQSEVMRRITEKKGCYIRSQRDEAFMRLSLIILFFWLMNTQSEVFIETFKERTLLEPKLRR